ncbi:hypothetical protein GCM10008959_26230 [Deinococcus seoulensis]|uniref:Uncharacterized protein n=1 Tax=Deinococcus seoulensis TaxID=1837379 RepID=A0ABQ2RWF5_9DEIO|nr:hypothetical protein GCM10008959_26230 [Deinococcus seoulensis]
MQERPDGGQKGGVTALAKAFAEVFGVQQALVVTVDGVDDIPVVAEFMREQSAVNGVRWPGWAGAASGRVDQVLLECGRDLPGVVEDADRAGQFRNAEGCEEGFQAGGDVGGVCGEWVPGGAGVCGRVRERAFCRLHSKPDVRVGREFIPQRKG